MVREEERGSERTIWIEQCGAGRWDNEWQGGGELLSCRRKAQMQSNGYFLSSTCSKGKQKLHVRWKSGLLYRPAGFA